ncbi:MAG: leucine-rich repeat domain-containing protein, partial [Coriobacteriales bacterium]|nr:leucine-rich repeat domain-containing protein [Coriobacteriales bacterium]
MTPIMRKLAAAFSLAIVLFISLAFTSIACAEVYSGTCGSAGDNLIWIVDTDTGILEISGNGTMKSYAGTATGHGPWCSANPTIVVIDEGVTSIGAYAFYECSSITQVEIPDSMTMIQNNSFSYCTSLRSIIIPQSVSSLGSSVFLGCTSLEAADVRCKKLSQGLFTGCSALETVTISAGVKTINASAFARCGSLKAVEIPDTVTTIENEAFMGCTALTGINLPDSVTSIGYSAFMGCSSLQSVAIPYGVGTLSDRTFKDCTSLITVSIPESVTTLVAHVFMGCSSLEAIEIPSSITYIGGNSFSECSSLVRISFLGPAPTIDDSAFSDITAMVYYPVGDPTWTEEVCQNYGGALTWVPSGVFSGVCGAEGDNLTWSLDTNTGVLVIAGTGDMGSHPWSEYSASVESVQIDDGVTSICAEAFRGCTSLESIALPDTVTSIGGMAFRDCSSLSCFIFPSGVTCVGMGEFWGCSSLVSVTLPNALESIESHAFRGCSALSSIVIPDSVQMIGEYAFTDCEALEEINIPEGMTEIGDLAFCGCTSLENLVIPSSVERLGQESICYCTSLKSMVIPASIVGDRAFRNCSNLESVTFTSNVSTIDVNAFAACNALKSIRFEGNAPSISSNSFSGVIATAYYPNNNPTWTANKRKGYGGNLTWEPYELTSGVCGNDLVWVLDTESGVLEITGTGGMYDYHHPEAEEINGNVIYVDGCAPWIYQRSYITSVVVDEGVTSVGTWSFPGCQNLSSVSLPSTLKTIGDGSFDYNTSLQSIVIPEGVESFGKVVFRGCHELNSISLPSTLIVMGSSCFTDCSSLEAIDLPEGIASIEPGTFRGCTSLATVSMPDSLESIGQKAFLDCSSLTSISIPEGVISIEDEAFCNCSALASVVFPDSLETIGGLAFQDCVSLTSITIPANVDNVGSQAFFVSHAAGPSSLSSVTFLGSAPSIGNSAFNNITATVFYPANDSSWTDSVRQDYGGSLTWLMCGECGDDLTWSYNDKTGKLSIAGTGAMYDYGGLTNRPPWWDLKTEVSTIELSDSISSIGDYAFSGCGISSITIPEGVSSIGRYSFAGCELLETAAIPTSVVTIGYQSFNNCVSLASVNFAENSQLVSIGSYAFSNTAIESIDIPGTVRSIGSFAFSGCGSLVSVDFPYGVTLLDYSVLSGCSSLVSVTIPASVTEIHGGAFANCASLESIVIPDSVTILGDEGNGGVFKGCTSLTEVTLSNNISIIRTGLFWGCTALQTITIPAGVSKINDWAFRDCTSLSLVYFEGHKPQFGTSVFTNVTAEASIPAFDDTWVNLGSYEGNITWVKRAADISNAVVQPVEPVYYTGTQHTPDVSVYLDDTALIKDADFELEFADNINAGEAHALVKGIDNYKGTIDVPFQILPLSLEDVEIVGIADQTWTGSDLRPEPELSIDGKTLVKDADYELAYEDNTELGTATITVTGKGNFSGMKTVTFQIVPADISGAEAATIADQPWIGSAITPEPVLSFNGKTLIAGSDYDLEYSDNIDLGTATITMTGKGNYAGTKTVTFQIVATDWEINDPGVIAPATGTVGRPITFSADISGYTPNLRYSYAWSWEHQWGDDWSSTRLRTGDYTAELSDTFVPKKSGTYYLWIDAIDPDGKSATSEQVAVVVSSADWSLDGIEVADSAYIGDEVEFSAKVAGDDADLVRFSYAWSWEGQWGDDWSSTRLRTGDYTTELSDTFTPTKEGTYYLWIDATDGERTETAERVAVSVTKVPPAWTLKGIEVTDSAYIGDEVEFSAKIEGDTTGLTYSY